MAFFDQIKDMAKAAAVKSEEFAKTVGKKAEAAMDMQKLSSEIDKKEHFIKDNYMQMGMEIYEKAGASEEIPAYLQEYCKLIDATQAEIDELQTKIDMIKQSEFGASPAKIPCPHCGAEILASSKFCPECGGSLKQEKAAKENSEAQNTVEDVPDEAVTENAVVAEPAETDVEKIEHNSAKEESVKSDIGLETEAAESNVPEAEEAKEAEPVLAEPTAADNEPKASDADDAITDAEIVEPVFETKPAEGKVPAEKKKEAIGEEELQEKKQALENQNPT